MPEQGSLFPETEFDQAAGLRRLFGARSAQVIAFVAASESCGRTTLLAQTATALAKTGLHVLLVDEHSEPDNLHAAFNTLPERDLLDLLYGVSSRELIQVPAPGVGLVAARRFAAELHHFEARDAGHLDAGLRELQQGVAFVLIDCIRRRSGELSLLALAARHLAVVVAARSESITHAYALIKRLAHLRGDKDFHIVVTRARNEAEAQAIFKNMRRAALEHLGVRLEYLGGMPVPESDHLADRLNTRLPLDDPGQGGGGFAPFAKAGSTRRNRAKAIGTPLESVV